jgi:hypothetical protein
MNATLITMCLSVDHMPGARKLRTSWVGEKSSVKRKRSIKHGGNDACLLVGMRPYVSVVLTALVDSRGDLEKLLAAEARSANQ